MVLFWLLEDRARRPPSYYSMQGYLNSRPGSPCPGLQQLDYIILDWWYSFWVLEDGARRPPSYYNLPHQSCEFFTLHSSLFTLHLTTPRPPAKSEGIYSPLRRGGVGGLLILHKYTVLVPKLHKYTKTGMIVLNIVLTFLCIIIVNNLTIYKQTTTQRLHFSKLIPFICKTLGFTSWNPWFYTLKPLVSQPETKAFRL